MSFGLALEGGGMRGVFTTGVLDVFLENNISFDCVAGVSAGACHACSYISGQVGRSLRVCTDYTDNKEYCGIYPLITTGDIFGSEFMYHTIPEKLDPLDNEAFIRNKTVMYAVVTNCETGKPEYYRINDAFRDVEYIRASSSLPGFSKMVEIDGKKFLDGGITDSIPVNFLVDSGFEKNVVVLTQPRNYVKGPNKLLAFFKLKYKQYPALVDAIEKRHIVYNAVREHIFEMEKQGRIFVIDPKEPLNIARIEKNRSKLFAAYNIGRSTAEERLEALKKFLK